MAPNVKCVLWCVLLYITGVLISLYPDQEINKLPRQILMFIYPIYNHNWRNISTIFTYRVIKKSLCTWRLQYSTHLMSWSWPSQNTFGMWTVLYWTRSSRTQFDVLINVWRLAGDTLNITCNFLFCNHRVHRDFLITLYNKTIIKRNILTIKQNTSWSRSG